MESRRPPSHQTLLWGSTWKRDIVVIYRNYPSFVHWQMYITVCRGSFASLWTAARQHSMSRFLSPTSRSFPQEHQKCWTNYLYSIYHCIHIRPHCNYHRQYLFDMFQIPDLLRDFVPTFHGVAADKQHGYHHHCHHHHRHRHHRHHHHHYYSQYWREVRLLRLKLWNAVLSLSDIIILIRRTCVHMIRVLSWIQSITMIFSQNRICHPYSDHPKYKLCRQTNNGDGVGFHGNKGQVLSLVSYSGPPVFFFKRKQKTSVRSYKNWICIERSGNF